MKKAVNVLYVSNKEAGICCWKIMIVAGNQQPGSWAMAGMGIVSCNRFDTANWISQFSYWIN